jgi:hypothetical protein
MISLTNEIYNSFKDANLYESFYKINNIEQEKYFSMTKIYKDLLVVKNTYNITFYKNFGTEGILNTFTTINKKYIYSFNIIDDLMIIATSNKIYIYTLNYTNNAITFTYNKEINLDILISLNESSIIKYINKIIIIATKNFIFYYDIERVNNSKKLSFDRRIIDVTGFISNTDYLNIFITLENQQTISYNGNDFTDINNFTVNSQMNEIFVNIINMN